MAEFTNIKINDIKYDIRDANAARASDLAAKQDVISDLSAIRSGAAKGATSVQTISVNGGTAQQPTNGVVNLTVATGGDNDLVGLSDGTENDGAVVFTKRNGDTITLNLNHVHPQYVESDDLADVATSGSYNDLTDKPVIPEGADLSGYYTKTEIDNKGFITTETDPTVPSWAKASKKPSYTASEVGAVPTTRKVNNKALSSDITLTASDVGAVPTTRTVNGKALSSNITLSASDVGALPSNTHIPADQVQSNWNETNTSSKAYIQNKPTIPAAQVNADWNATSGVSRILNKPTIPTVPTKVSSFTNDAGYLTQHQSLANYYTKSEIDTKIGNIETLLASI